MTPNQNITNLNSNGVLPTGIHKHTLEEIRIMFGSFTSSDKREKLFAKFNEYVSELRWANIADHIIVNGSFVTEKDIPEDIDIIVLLKKGIVPNKQWTPYKSNLISSRYVRSKYGIDVLLARSGGKEYDEHLEYFAQVKNVPGINKGLVRLDL